MTDNISLRQVASKLVTIRKQRNITRPQMAAELNISLSAYTKYETKRNFPSFEVLSRLVKKFNISLDWLLLNKGPMHFSHTEKMMKENELLKQQIAEEEERKNLAPVIPEDAMVITEPELKDLFGYMQGNPLFKHQLLTHFYNYKLEGNKQALIEG